MSKEIDWGGAINPVGTIINYLGTIAPDGYLFCDGTEYNIADYPALANHFETNFGTKNFFGGDGTTTFKVPDLQGEFLRCTGTNPNAYGGAGANVGSHQQPTGSPYVGFYWSGSGGNINMPKYSTGPVNPDSTIGNSVGVAFVNVTAGSGSHAPLFTSRPTNTSVWYCIKY